MKKALQTLHSSRLREQRGATVILIALLMPVFLGIAALAIDLTNLYVVRNELQNAADAGALAGARLLYNDDGTVVNPGTNQVAYDAATANKALSATGAIAVNVNWTSGNTGEVQRGHWQFALGENHGFTANDSLLPVDLGSMTTEELDHDPNFINAVKVVARRADTPAASFFARIFGYQNFALSAEAVAYIGFAGTLRPGDVDQPIAICKQSITDAEGKLTCTTGRMINSSGSTTSNTGAWTNFSQPSECTGGASSNDLQGLVCGGGNPAPITYGREIQTINGEVNVSYSNLRNCWMNASGLKDWRGFPREAWSLTLPVIDCPDSSPGPCSKVVGAVTLDVLWVMQANADPQWREVPFQMEGWECSVWAAAGHPTSPQFVLTDIERKQCFDEFASTFNLQTADGSSVGTLDHNQLQKTILFRPNCEPHELQGTTGGDNYGVLSRIPVLVK